MPRRTCVGCRTTAAATDLLRVAATEDGTLVVDRSAPGRGAWLCRVQGSGELQGSCLDAAWRRQAFQRALRRPVGAGSIDALRSGGGEHETLTQDETRRAVPAKRRPRRD